MTMLASRKLKGIQNEELTKGMKMQFITDVRQRGVSGTKNEGLYKKANTKRVSAREDLKQGLVRF